MNKVRFELYLREKLAILKQSEIDEIINEYLQHIDMRKVDGVSEEEAISDFGDLDELVKEIFDAYKIDTSNNQFDNFSETVKKRLNNALNFINRLTSSLMKRTGKEIVSLIVEFVLVLILIGVISFIVDLIANNIISIFYFSPYFLIQIIRFVVRILSIVLNFTISISILYWFASERILKKDPNVIIFSKQTKTDFKDKEAQQTKVQSDIIFEKQSGDKQDIANDDKSDLKESTASTKVVRPNKALEDLQAQAEKKPFAQRLFDGNLFVLKAVLFIILIPMIVVAVFLGIVFITLVYNTIIGYGSIGLSLILSGGLLIYFYILILGINFVSGGKSK